MLCQFFGGEDREGENPLASLSSPNSGWDLGFQKVLCSHDLDVIQHWNRERIRSKSIQSIYFTIIQIIVNKSEGKNLKMKMVEEEMDCSSQEEYTLCINMSISPDYTMATSTKNASILPPLR